LHKNDLSLFSPAKVILAIVISKQKQGFMEAIACFAFVGYG